MEIGKNSLGEKKVSLIEREDGEKFEEDVRPTLVILANRALGTRYRKKPFSLKKFEPKRRAEVFDLAGDVFDRCGIEKTISFNGDSIRIH